MEVVRGEDVRGGGCDGWSCGSDTFLCFLLLPVIVHKHLGSEAGRGEGGGGEAGRGGEWVWGWRVCCYSEEERERKGGGGRERKEQGQSRLLL